MQPTEPLPIHHSWPLFDAENRFDLGLLHDDDRPAQMPAGGRWACDLDDGDRLTWSDAVHDLFGLPRGVRIERRDTVGLYAENSRAAMERLRAYAIRHRRGFTLDAEIRPATGAPRWMRLIAAPICIDKRVVRLEGVKLDVSALYR